VTDTIPYPGQTMGLPETGPGSLARWGSRLGALVLDWGASMIVALGAFGGGVLTESGWKAWMVLAVYFVQKFVLTALTGTEIDKKKVELPSAIKEFGSYDASVRLYAGVVAPFKLKVEEL